MSREVLQMALAVLKGCLEHQDAQDLIIAIEHELAQPKQEPVAWVDVKDTHHGPYEFHGKELLPVGKHDLYAAPPQRQPLTTEEIDKLMTDAARYRKLAAMEAELVEPITIWHYLRNPDDLDNTHGIGDKT